MKTLKKYYYGKITSNKTKNNMQNSVCSMCLLCLKKNEKLRLHICIFLYMPKETLMRTRRSDQSGIIGSGKWAEGGTDFSLYSILHFFKKLLNHMNILPMEKLK